MEVINEPGARQPATIPTTETAALDIIRTETVLSRMPVHNLAKRGKVNIQILKTTPDGKVELKWIVSYSDRYGQARQLAYKLDTIVINHRIDEQGRPLPQMICLGSLRDVADQLDLGGDTNKVRRALRQNASAFITAKFEYRGNDGTKKTLEADFTRYSVVFTGEQLPDGRRADAVYIILNDPYREVLNNAPVRPLDRAYMKELPPGAQRFYEIISYKIFSAIKNHYPFAKIRYSEYCTFSAQLRHYDRQPVQDQMAKVIRPHKESGYIAAVRYEPKIDGENKPDWILYLTPGPKAEAEFATAHRRKPRKSVAAANDAGGDTHTGVPRSVVRERHARSKPVAPQPTFDPQLIAEFTRRGINEKKAIELLTNVKPGQDVIAQLEHAEHTVKQLQNTQHQVRNPAGFIVRLIELNTPIPDGFETGAMRKAREEKERKEQERRATQDAREQWEWDYDRYCAAEVDRHIQANPAEYESLKNAKATEERTMRPTSWPELIETAAKIYAKNAIQEKLSLPTFEEFVAHKKQGTGFSLKQVVVSPDPESAAVGLQREPENPVPVAELAVNTEFATEPLGDAASDTAEAVSTPDAEPAIDVDVTDGTTVEPPADGEPKDAVLGSVEASAEPAAGDAATPEAVAGMPAPEEAAMERLIPAGADPAAAIAERGEVTELAATSPGTSEPAELIADPPPEEPGAEPIEPELI